MITENMIYNFLHESLFEDNNNYLLLKTTSYNNIHRVNILTVINKIINSEDYYLLIYNKLQIVEANGRIYYSTSFEDAVNYILKWHNDIWDEEN